MIRRVMQVLRRWREAWNRRWFATLQEHRPDPDAERRTPRPRPDGVVVTGIRS